MAPSGRRIRRRTISTRSMSNKSAKHTTNIQKKKIISNDTETFRENVSMETHVTGTCATTTNSEALNDGCSTPKGKKFRIPRINKCPPAPMKRRSSTIFSSSACTSLKRSPVAFFSPPDLELFFFFASSDHLCTLSDNTNTTV